MPKVGFVFAGKRPERTCSKPPSPAFPSISSMCHEGLGAQIFMWRVCARSATVIFYRCMVLEVLYCASLPAEVVCTQLDNWPKARVECGAMKPVINSARAMAPAVPRAPQAPPLAIPIAGSDLAPFRPFLLACCGAHAPRGQNKHVDRCGSSISEFILIVTSITVLLILVQEILW